MKKLFKIAKFHRYGDGPAILVKGSRRTVKEKNLAGYINIGYGVVEK